MPDVGTADDKQTDDPDIAAVTDDESVENQGTLGKIGSGIRWLYWRHLSYGGLAGGLVFFLLSLTPSLLPRNALFAGVVGGVSAAAGYGVGSLISALLRKWVDEPPESTKRWAWWGLLIAAVVLIPIFLTLSTGWQNTVRELMDMGRFSGWAWGPVLIIAAITAYLLLVTFRFVRAAFMGLVWLADLLLPRAIAVTLGVVATFLLVIGFVQGVLVDGVVSVVGAAYSVNDGSTTEGTFQSQSEFRSGSPASLVSWESLGNQGRDFAGEGEAVSFEEIKAFNGGEAIEPIRVYVGLKSADTVEERVDLALAELDRTNAWERNVIAVYTTTGTGWIDPKVADSLDYMHAGNVASVGLQYSYLPSAISILVDQDEVADVAFRMINAVSDRVAQLPEADRPRLVVFGESLGSFGIEHAFTGITDLSSKIDGGMLAGPPWFNPLWGPLTDAREPGTPVWRPIYNNGETVRFVVNPETDFDNPPGTEWPEPRLVYLQNASDPIVWFSISSFFAKPGWMDDPRGPDVTPDMEWFPLVTGFQLLADLAYSTGVPGGHGHKYGSNTTDGWAAIAAPDGWTDTDTQRLKEVIGEL
ncbi:MAG: alpha/beta-hydrolase family protein [Acidimicrobiia bacterium]|nr:MAG: alpha/beta-hydrolase family protein [Acidimicrobiia bacterium]